MIQSVSELLKV